MTNEELFAFAHLMGDVYSLLFECFSHPTVEFANRLSSGVIHDAFVAIMERAADEPDVARALDMVDASRFEGMDDDKLRLRIEVDYNRLFIGPEKLIAPPYESVYLSKRDFFLKSDEDPKSIIDPIYAASIKREYSARGYRISSDYSDFADNIMFELDYCSYLCRRAAKAYKEGDLLAGDNFLSCKDRFIVEHPLRWIDALVTRIEGSTELGFQESVVILTRRIMQLDTEGFAG
jgi:TorA maturation chaperone TorD